MGTAEDAALRGKALYTSDFFKLAEKIAEVMGKITSSWGLQEKYPAPSLGTPTGVHFGLDEWKVLSLMFGVRVIVLKRGSKNAVDQFVDPKGNWDGPTTGNDLNDAKHYTKQDPTHEDKRVKYLEKPPRRIRGDTFVIVKRKSDVVVQWANYPNPKTGGCGHFHGRLAAKFKGYKLPTIRVEPEAAAAAAVVAEGNAEGSEDETPLDPGVFRPHRESAAPRKKS